MEPNMLDTNGRHNVMQADDLDEEQSGHHLCRLITIEDHLSAIDLGKSLINHG